MTKLPKRLEEMIEKKGEEYAAVYTCPPVEKYCSHDVLCAHKKGATDLTLAVLSEAEKLAIALDAMIKAARDNNCGLRIADEALSNWKKFLGDE